MAISNVTIERIRKDREVLIKELELIDAMIENILTGKPISYGLGTRNVSRYPVNISELMNLRDRLTAKIQEDDNILAGNGKRKSIRIVPMDF